MFSQLHFTLPLFPIHPFQHPFSLLSSNSANNCPRNVVCLLSVPANGSCGCRPVQCIYCGILYLAQMLTANSSSHVQTRQHTGIGVALAIFNIHISALWSVWFISCTVSGAGLVIMWPNWHQDTPCAMCWSFIHWPLVLVSIIRSVSLFHAGSLL